jgi:hypothetical protein
MLQVRPGDGRVPRRPYPLAGAAPVQPIVASALSSKIKNCARNALQRSLARVQGVIFACW